MLNHSTTFVPSEERRSSNCLYLLTDLYIFLIRNDVWIYILSGLGLFWYFTNLVLARRILRGAVFSLERERGESLQQSALLFIFFFIAVVGAVTYVNLEVAPTIPAELLKPPTPTPNLIATPLSSPTPLGSRVPVSRFTPTPPIAATVTQPGNNSGPPIGDGNSSPPTRPPEDNGSSQSATIAPTNTLPPSVPVSRGCSPLVNITQPTSGSATQGGLSIYGTAISADYKLEIRGPQTNNEWAALTDETVFQPVDNNFLGNANIAGWTAGTYDIRLVVIDTTSNEVGSCTIEVNLQ
jgi:hypothetical protein